MHENLHLYCTLYNVYCTYAKCPRVGNTHDLVMITPVKKVRDFLVPSWDVTITKLSQAGNKQIILRW
jgi:hypothetical protein